MIILMVCETAGAFAYEVEIVAGELSEKNSMPPMPENV